MSGTQVQNVSSVSVFSASSRCASVIGPVLLPEPATAHPPSGGTPIVLEPWDVTVLVEQRDPETGAVPDSPLEREEQS